MCNDNIIEDEIHVLTQCPLYDDIRANLIKCFTDTGMSLMDQFLYLLSCSEQQAALAKCIYRSMKRRDIFKNVFINL